MELVVNGIIMRSIFGHQKYFIDKAGQYVYSKKRKKGRFLKISFDQGGYKIVGQIDQLHTPGIHRLVWLAWKGEIPKGYQIDHKDHNILNSDISNLRMLSKEEHNKYHSNSQITKQKMSNSKKGHPVSQQTRQKMRTALKGKLSHPRTPQMIKKFKQTMRRKRQYEQEERI